MPAAILFVCTANICRSPAAEYLARHRFGEEAALFPSAGFMFDGRESPKELASALDAKHVDVRPHRSAILDADTLGAADLVLTMEARHLQEATVIAPDAFPKMIPLIDAAARVRRGQTLEEFIGSIEGRDPMRYLDSRFDVDDPYKRSMRRYRKAVDEIAGLVATTIGALRF